MRRPSDLLSLSRAELDARAEWLSREQQRYLSPQSHSGRVSFAAAAHTVAATLPFSVTSGAGRGGHSGGHGGGDHGIQSLANSMAGVMPGMGGMHAPHGAACSAHAPKGLMRGCSNLMSLGREELLMREADVHRDIVVKSNNRDRVGLTGVELSHLHQQLQGITTTCTLIIGFAMASLSADLLGALGDSRSQFCVYKSVASTVLSALFIILTTTTICACFTIIACVQIIVFQSQRAIFSRAMVHKVTSSEHPAPSRRRPSPQQQLPPTASSRPRKVNLTSRVVRMTQLVVYGDRSAHWDSHARPSAKREGGRLAFGGFTIYIGLCVALSCFFLSTVILTWLFISPVSGKSHAQPSPQPLAPFPPGPLHRPSLPPCGACTLAPPPSIAHPHKLAAPHRSEGWVCLRSFEGCPDPFAHSPVHLSPHPSTHQAPPLTSPLLSPSATSHLTPPLHTPLASLL